MASIVFHDGTVEVDAALVARGLRLDPAALQQGLRDGSITSLCERGVAEDAGRFRLTFYSPLRRLRVILDQDGEILTTSSSSFQRRSRD